MIELRGVKKAYGSSDNCCEILKGINLTVETGSFTVILGASGSGKSTLLNIMSGLERPDEGSVIYENCDITLYNDVQLTKFRKDKIAFIFQQYYLIPDITVGKNVKMSADLVGNKEYKNIIKHMGLEDKINKYPYELSGGEQQRTAIARALAKKPKFLFLDEPTGALDEKTGRQILDYIFKLKDEYKFTAVMVTHNRNISETADSVIEINSGAVTKSYVNSEPKSAYEIGW